MAMDRTDSTAAMASLASYAEESESDEEAQPMMSAVDTISDDEHDTPTIHQKSASQTSKPASSLTEDENSRSDMGTVERVKAKKRKAKLVSYAGDDMEESSSSEEDDERKTEEQSVQSEGHGRTVVEGKVRHSSLNVEQASSLSRAMLNKSLDEIELPPEPPTHCSKQLQEKIASLYERKIKEGLNLNNNIQNRVDFRNPSIYEKLIEFCGIDEKGTNYPPELYDPSIWGKESYYDALDKAQKQDMEKREKEKKERTKVEFVTATKKTGSKVEVISIDDKKRKSKWDEPGHTAAGRIVESINKSLSANLTSHVSGTKSTVIPATGSISKKPSK